MNISVTVSGTEEFKGMLCQVRMADDPSVILGQMEVTENMEKLQVKNCLEEPNSVTHRNSDLVQSVSFTWWPPMGDMHGNVKCM